MKAITTGSSIRVNAGRMIRPGVISDTRVRNRSGALLGSASVWRAGRSAALAADGRRPRQAFGAPRRFVSRRTPGNECHSLTLYVPRGWERSFPGHSVTPPPTRPIVAH
jgi:hypothetical protein